MSQCRSGGKEDGCAIAFRRSVSPQTLTSLTKIFRKEFSLEFSRTVEYNKGQLGILDKVRLERAQRETQEDNIRTTSP